MATRKPAKRAKRPRAKSGYQPPPKSGIPIHWVPTEWTTQSKDGRFWARVNMRAPDKFSAVVGTPTATVGSGYVATFESACEFAEDQMLRG